MKGPSEKGDQFAVLEYMKAGQVVTHPQPLNLGQRHLQRHLQVADMCNCSAWCMIARVFKPYICRLLMLVRTWV